MITATVNDKEKTNPKKTLYPYLGVWGSIVVFFTGPRTGMYIANIDGSTSSGIGDYRHDLTEEKYTRLYGSVTLTQLD